MTPTTAFSTAPSTSSHPRPTAALDGRGEVIAFDPGTLDDPLPAVDRAMSAFRHAVRGRPRAAYERARAELAAMRTAAARGFGGDAGGWALADGATVTADRVADVLARVLARRDGRIQVAAADVEHAGGLGAFASDPRFQVVTVPIDRLPFTPARVILVSHLAYDTNRDHSEVIRKLVQREDRPIVVVDGSQALGQVRVDVEVLGCHVYFGCADRWLRGPLGAGLLFLHQDVRASWPSPFRGGEPLCAGLPIGRWEPRGAQDFARIAGITAAVEGLAPPRSPRLREHLVDALEAQLGPRLRVHPASAPHGRVVSFGLRSADVHAVAIALAERGVVVECVKRRSTTSPTGQLELVRVGLPARAQEEHVDRAVAALVSVVRELEARSRARATDGPR